MKNDLPMIAMAAAVAVVSLAAIFFTPLADINVSNADLRRTIDTTGTVTLMSEPNEVEVYLAVETEGTTAKEAQEKNSAAADKVMKALVIYDVETSSFSVSPRYDFSEGGRGEIVGYTARHSIKATSSDTTKAGNIVDLAVNAGANRIDSVVFDLTDKKKEDLTKAALSDASQAAKKKADSIAGSLGARITRLSSVSETSSSFIPYQRAGFDTSEAATAITPGDVEIRASVFGSWEIA